MNTRKKTTMSKVQQENIQSDSPIDKLNVDCLKEIFLKLPAEDRIRIETVCKKWQAVSLTTWSDIKTLKVTRFYPVDEDDDAEDPCSVYDVIIFKDNREREVTWCVFPGFTEQIVTRFGRYLNELSLFSNADYSLDLTPYANKCPNITKLYITAYQYSVRELGYFIRQCEKLKFLSLYLREGVPLRVLLKQSTRETITELELYGREVDNTSITISDVETIFGLKNLRELTLVNISFGSERPKCKVKNEILENIYMTDCRLKYPITLLDNLCNLRELMFATSLDIDDEFLRCLARRCIHLQLLNIYFCPFVTDAGISDFARILQKKAQLKRDKTSISNDSYASPLENFDCGDCESITDTGLITIVKYSQKLKFLRADNPGLTQNSLRIIQNMLDRRSNSVMLTVGVNEDVVNRSDKFNMSPLLRIAPF